MFALGASGTGKTSRYFGLPNLDNEKNKVGVIPYIIKKYSEKSGVQVELAYCVCYGQKADLSTLYRHRFDCFLSIYQHRLQHSKASW